jgi:hypothetical protein
VSLPLPPYRLSLSAPPFNVSSPAFPYKVSFPPKPFKTSPELSYPVIVSPISLPFSIDFSIN